MSDTTTVRPTLGALFMGFFSVGICGFGGVLPWARRMIVEQRRWLTGAEFTDLMGLCQFLPGPNVINVSVALGARYHGPLGSVVAFSGLMAAPMVIVLILGVAYDTLVQHPLVRDAFNGLAATASGLVIAMAIKIGAPLRDNWLGLAVAVATLVAIVVLRWPLAAVLGVMAPASIALAWWRMR